MAEHKPWLKMWVAWIDDPIMREATGGLTLSEQGIWWRLYSVAQICAADGLLVRGSGEPYTILQIIDICRLRDSELPIFESMLSKMLDANMIHWEDDTLMITNFKKEQSIAPSSLPSAVRDRVNKSRQKKKKGSPNNPSKKDDDITEERGQRTEQNSLRNEDVTTGKLVTSDSVSNGQIPYEQIVDLFNKICISLPRVKTITKKRKTAIKNAIKKEKDLQKTVTGSLQFFEELFNRVELSDFLSGRKISALGTDHSNWRCSFDWILEEKHRVRILEGNYDNREQLPKPERDHLSESRNRGLEITED